jgi:pimeloyl-ACP methyl ester carboxylesterase
VACTDVGAGRPILCVHGLPGSSFDFRWLDAAIGDRARVIRVDLPGFGGTPLGDTAPTVAARTAVVAALIDALALDDLVVVGHSFGGPTAVALAADPRVTGVGLLAATGLRPHRMFRRLAGARPLLGAARLLGPWVLRRAYAAAGFAPVFSDEALLYVTRAVGALDWEGHRAAIRALAVPTLVAWADDDPFIEPAIEVELEAAVPDGPRIHHRQGGHAVQKTLAVEIADGLIALGAPPS